MAGNPKIPVDPHEVIRVIYRETYLTQRELAEALGVNPSRIKQIINGYDAKRRVQVPGQVTIEEAIEEATSG